MRALITGITGQDGAYLAQLLLTKGYEVFGLVRRSASPTNWRLNELQITDKIQFLDGDLTDISSLIRAVKTAEPDEIYNLAAQSFVGTSWNQPIITANVTALGAINMLEATRLEQPKARYYQASTSEMFGNATDSPQSETTPFAPRSPYAAAKLHAHHATINYREAFNLHASCGIMFNHESPLRGLEFVTRKTTDAVARIKLGLAKNVTLGDLIVLRDWGHAKDYAHAMWLMLQQETPDDYVIATGITHTVGQMCFTAFRHAELTPIRHIIFDPDLIRPAEVNTLHGDATKAMNILGWKPTITFETMIEEMVDADIERHQGHNR